MQRTSYTATLQASYEIDFWGKNRAAVEAAQQTASATRFDVAAITLTTEAAVANTYFQILASREQFAIQQENLDAAERILALLRQQLTVGTATGLDVAQQQTLVDQQRALLPPLRQSIDQNTASLGTLTGHVPQTVAPPQLGLEDVRVPESGRACPSMCWSGARTSGWRKRTWRLPRPTSSMPAPCCCPRSRSPRPAVSRAW